MSDRLPTLPPPPRRIRPPARPRRLHVALTLGFIAAASLTLGAPWANVVIRPGPLSSPHAQILGGIDASGRCVACHDGFTGPAAASTSVSPTPSPWGEACLKCHRPGLGHGTGGDGSAFDPHGLPRSTWSTERSDELPSIGCNDCHREHRGARADLTAISDARCQACHESRFESFGRGHPPFELAAASDGTIEFNHASHRLRHYPAGGEAGFDCRQCHLTDARIVDPIITTVGYDAACGRCHDGSLRVAASTPLTVLQVPEVDAEQAERLGGWPAAAVGLAARHPDAPPTAGETWTRWLSGTIDHDPVAASALMDDLERRGQAALMQRLQRLGSHRDAAVIAASVPPQWMAQTVNAWRRSPDPVRPGDRGAGPAAIPGASSDGLLSPPQNRLDWFLEDPLALDPLEPEPLAIAPPAKAVAKAVGATDPDPPPPPWGGWSRNDATLSLQYRAAIADPASAHADPILTSLINLAVSARPDSGRDAVLAHPAIAACRRCHSMPPGRGSTPSATMRWVADGPPPTGLKSLHHFDHRPHLGLGGAQDCGGCHVETTAASEKFGVRSSNDFAAIAQSRCQQCHRRGSARDDCMLCHRYHGR